MKAADAIAKCQSGSFAIICLQDCSKSVRRNRQQFILAAVSKQVLCENKSLARKIMGSGTLSQVQATPQKS